MCCPSKKVIKSDTKRFLALRGLHEDKLCDTLQAVAPTNVKTVHQTSLPHIDSKPDRLGLLSPTHCQHFKQESGQITLQSVLINKLKVFKGTRHAEIRRIEISRSMVVETLNCGSQCTNQHPVVQSPLHP